MNFGIEAWHNPYLPPDSRRIDAILTVTAGEPISGSGRLFGRVRAEALVLDVSGSMHGERLSAVKNAAHTAIALLDEATLFCVVAFNHDAQLVFALAPATTANKAAAQAAVRRLSAGGATRLSQGLAIARQEFLKTPDALRHALFLTDGKNAPEDESSLRVMLQRCENVFQCDCRGVGTDWQPDQLRQISGALLGSARIIPQTQGIEADFRSTLQTALARSAPDVRLRLWTPKTARVLLCKQMSPDILDLTNRGVQVEPQARDYPTGAWGEESRDYYVAIEIAAGVTGDEMLACRAWVVHAPQGTEVKSPPALILTTWTSDEDLSARIEPQLAHYTGQEELAETIRLGLEARARGDARDATVKLGRAVQIAHESGNEETTRRLRKVVDVMDAGSGTVRLKPGVDRADEMDLDLMSTRTRRAARKTEP